MIFNNLVKNFKYIIKGSKKSKNIDNICLLKKDKIYMVFYFKKNVICKWVMEMFIVLL